jgi:O-antigen ligase
MTQVGDRARHAAPEWRAVAAAVRARPAPVVAWTATFLLTFLTTLGPVYSVRLGMGPVVGNLTDDGAVVVFFATFYAAVIGGIAWVGPHPRPRRALTLPLAGFCCVVLASTLWSVNTSRTFTLGVLVALTAAAGLVVGRATSVPLQVTAIFASQHLGGMLSVIAIARHAPRSHDFGGRWAGIYITRNSLGPVAALGLIAAAGCACLLWTRRERWSPWLVALAGAAVAAASAIDVVLLAKSGALTPAIGMGAAALGVGALVVLRSLSNRSARAAARNAAITLAGLTVLGAILWFGKATFTPWVGKDPTLDQRTPLWRYIIPLANQRPFAGYGWQGVWRIVDPRRTHGLFEAHNGFLESYLGTGVLGTALLVTFVVVLLWLTARTAAAAGGRWFWPFALVLYAVVSNQLESFIGANLLPWVLLTMAAATLGPARGRAAPPAAANGPSRAGRSAGG